MKRVRPEPDNGARLPAVVVPLTVEQVPPPTGLIARLRRASSSLLAQSSPKKPDYRTKLLAYSRFDSYKLNGEDSQLHWEALTHRSHRHVKLLQATSWALVLGIGFSLALIAAALAWLASTAHQAMALRTAAAMWPASYRCSGDEGEITSTSGGGDCGYEAPRAVEGYLVFVGIRLTMVLGAALLVYWQPDAAISGLPKIKSNLNGTKIPGYLSFRVLVAKIVGTTLVVGSGLPLGKEGPMVHIGNLALTLNLTL